MSVTSHPVSAFPAMTSHGNPAGVPSISVHACVRAFARARAIRSSMAGAPARSSARRAVGPLGAAPSTGARCWGHRDVAHAGGPQRDRRRQQDQHDTPVQQRRRAFPAQRGTQPPGKSRLVRGLPRQHRAGVAGQARPVRGALQGMVPAVMLHGEERSRSRSYTGVVTA